MVYHQQYNSTETITLKCEWKVCRNICAILQPPGYFVHVHLLKGIHAIQYIPSNMLEALLCVYLSWPYLRQWSRRIQIPEFGCHDIDTICGNAHDGYTMIFRGTARFRLYRFWGTWIFDIFETCAAWHSRLFSSIPHTWMWGAIFCGANQTSMGP